MDIVAWLVAATEKIDPSKIGLTDPEKDANKALEGILNTTYAWAGIICIIVIIIAGYYYTNSSGDSAGVQRAKQAIVGSIVGLVIIMMAFAVTQFALGRF